MAAPKRTRGQRENDRSFIARLYLQGKTQQVITDAINDRYAKQEIGIHLSRQSILNDIKWIRKQWLDSALVDFNEVKAVELAKIDDLEREYREAWERSQRDAETRIAEKTSAGQADAKKKGTTSTKAVSKKVGQVGNPKFLEGVQWCIEQRIKIFGLHAPKQVDVNWRQEAESQGLDADEILETAVDAYLEALAAGAEPAEFRSVQGSTATPALSARSTDLDSEVATADPSFGNGS